MSRTTPPSIILPFILHSLARENLQKKRKISINIRYTCKRCRAEHKNLTMFYLTTSLNKPNTTQPAHEEKRPARLKVVYRLDLISSLGALSIL